tara:strand:+ start:165 stop:461 length:297 start_codon:yes stop_codon:yes gene_type:complete
MSQIYPFDPANLQGNMTTNKVDDPNMRYSWGFKFKEPNCENVTYKLNDDPSVMFGSNKPLDEKCTNITGNLTYDPSTSGNSLWNNSTRRKIIVNNKRN